jgi:hypothetical protein
VIHFLRIQNKTKTTSFNLIETMRVVVHHQAALLSILAVVVPACAAHRGGPFHYAWDVAPSSPTTATVTTAYRPFDIYGPIWGVNTMWNIECHDMSHVNEELSKMKKVEEVKRHVVVQQQQGKYVFALGFVLAVCSSSWDQHVNAKVKDPYMIV